MLSGSDIGYIFKVMPKLITTIPLMLFIVLCSGMLGFLLGILFTAIRIKKMKVLYPILLPFLSFVRSSPVLLQLFITYYGIPFLLKLIGININSWSQITFAVITLTFAYGVYVSDVLRPAILAVGKGQYDAADSIGLTGYHKYLRIIWPQAIPIALPSLGNLILDLLKDTSILFSIGVVDLMGKAKNIISFNYGIGKIQIYIAVALIYWGISIFVERGIVLLEKRYEKLGFTYSKKGGRKNV